MLSLSSTLNKLSVILFEREHRPLQTLLCHPTQRMAPFFWYSCSIVDGARPFLYNAWVSKLCGHCCERINISITSLPLLSQHFVELKQKKGLIWGGVSAVGQIWSRSVGTDFPLPPLQAWPRKWFCCHWHYGERQGLSRQGSPWGARCCILCWLRSKINHGKNRKQQHW